MAYEAIAIKCPHCGAPAQINQQKCNYCRQPIIISTMHQVLELAADTFDMYRKGQAANLHDHPENADLNMTMGLCYLRLGLYNQAQSSFEKAIHADINNSEAYFYEAIALMRGRRGHKLSRTEVDKIEDYLDAAIVIEPKGIYYYLKAYIRFDYYKRKHIQVIPDYLSLLSQAEHRGVSAYDKVFLYQILKVEKPSCM